MPQTTLENLQFECNIQEVDFTFSKFYVASGKTEGKFLIYRKENRIKLYGLLWSDDSEERKSRSGDWYDFDMKKINYDEIPHWIFRAELLESWNGGLTSKKVFDVNEELIGGGYLTFLPRDLIWRTAHDRDFQRAPVDIIRRCLEEECRIMKIEVTDEINERMFRYESPRH